MERQTGNRLIDLKAGCRMNGESSMERYTLTCKIAGGNLVYHSGNSNQGSVTTYGGRVEGGREAQLEGDICIPVADPC